MLKSFEEKKNENENDDDNDNKDDDNEDDDKGDATLYRLNYEKESDDCSS